MGFLDDIIDPQTATRHIEQGSDEWDRARLTRFTSSEWHYLMECGTRPMTDDELKARPKTGKGSKTKFVPDPSKMSDTGLKYIRKKVWETLTGASLPQPYAYPLVYGKETEALAAEFYEQKYGVEAIKVGFQPFGDHAGGSPDRLIGDDEGLEIKCPSSEEQINYLLLTDHYDLKREYPKIYWQCISLMLFTDRKVWNLSTYDPRMIDDKLRLTRIRMEWDKVEEDIDAVIKSLEGAVKEKLELINLLSR